MQIHTAAIAALATTAGLAATASANHIDFIQDDSNVSNGILDATFSLSTDGDTVTDTQMGESADILGGMRSVSLSRNGGFGGTITAEKAQGTDYIDVQNSNVSAGTLVLDYPGISDSDFASSWNAIAVDIPVLTNAVGDGEINLSVTVESSAGTGTAFADGSGLAPGRIEDAGTYTFFFDDAGFDGVDFSDVDRVSVTFETAIVGTDFQVASITREIPAPATAGLLGLGGLAAGRRRRN